MKQMDTYCCLRVNLSLHPPLKSLAETRPEKTNHLPAAATAQYPPLTTVILPFFHIRSRPLSLKLLRPWQKILTIFLRSTILIYSPLWSPLEQDLYRHPIVQGFSSILTRTLLCLFAYFSGKYLQLVCNYNFNSLSILSPF